MQQRVIFNANFKHSMSFKHTSFSLSHFQSHLSHLRIHNAPLFVHISSSKTPPSKHQIILNFHCPEIKPTQGCSYSAQMNTRDTIVRSWVMVHIPRDKTFCTERFLCQRPKKRNEKHFLGSFDHP